VVRREEVVDAVDAAVTVVNTDDVIRERARRVVLQAAMSLHSVVDLAVAVEAVVVMLLLRRLFHCCWPNCKFGIMGRRKVHFVTFEL
jgi:hypothetical protein